MVRKALNVLILLPLAIVLIVLSVANRQTVAMALNPFRPEDTVLRFEAPFFVFLFAALILGMIVGSLATWFAQGKYRKRARLLREESLKWQQTASASRTQPAPRQIGA
ncbi:lipopolysaccharide assembly protein LapA domain-containing protein [Gellertiella hungarica]|uniref:Putative integral membrane protein n=1 Tax=Gellertiella hungarica TaxID=1572859 RepID=A0A7W6NJW7_9HYPH|nr:lipopolysaccharide assembly protein LapA domain-containing protein [Gellertiella hungarica]MBB4063790.1 putative integral membrane protein [Gellertiella hungarica]